MKRSLLPGLCGAFLLTLLAACGGPAPRLERAPEAGARPPAQRGMQPNTLAPRGGGVDQAAGRPEGIPENIDDIPDAEPRWEPLHRFANRPYVVLGKEYVPMTRLQPYKVRGIGSWYGKKFHGQKTSIGEPYDMFAMTAAHPTLAIPSYARVTNVATGKSVIVRITDRGPFHADRVIDLSFTAAYRLGYVANGSTAVEVESIVLEPGATYAAAPALEVAAIKRQTARQEARPAPVREERDPIAEMAMAAQAQDEPAAAPAPAPAAVAGVGNVFLQLGAFSSQDNAESLKAKLARELDWLTDAIQIQSKGGMHRIHVGPYRDRMEADKVAERIRLALGFKPTFVTR